MGVNVEAPRPTAPPTMLTFEVKGEDVCVQLASTHTLFDLMKIVCKEWLDEVRGGDGGVHDHVWTITSRLGRHMGPYMGDDGYYLETPQQSTRLKKLGLNVGGGLGVEYDMGRTTLFTLHVTAIAEATPDELAKCPRAVRAADTVPASFAPHVPPAGTPTLDDLFPHLASLAFAPGTTTLYFFPCGDGCAGAIEAGPNAMGDLLFAPHAFSDAEEFLLAADAAAAMGPGLDVRDDAYSRLVFPARMAKAQEKKYAKFVKQLSSFDKAMSKSHGDSSAGLSRLHVEMLMGPEQVAVRISRV